MVTVPIYYDDTEQLCGGTGLSRALPDMGQPQKGDPAGVQIGLVSLAAVRSDDGVDVFTALYGMGECRGRRCGVPVHVDPVHRAGHWSGAVL